MKRKVLITSLFVVIFCLLLAVGISAATTNEFADTPEKIDGIDLTGMSTDANARVVLKNGDEYHTYPAQYVVTNADTFTYDFTRIKNANGVSYTKNSVVRIEVPDPVLIAPETGVLCSCSELVEIKFSPNSQLHTLLRGCFYNNRKMKILYIPPRVTTMGDLIINNSTIEELIFMDGFSAVPPTDSFKGATGLKKLVFSNQMTTMHHSAFNSTIGEELEEVYLGASLVDFGDVAPENVNGGSGQFPWAKYPFIMYAPETLFANLDTIERGRLTGWNGTSLPTGVLFYTGTMAQAQALVDKAESDTPIFNNATLVEWDSTKTDDEYMPSSGWTIVYGYNKCRAFYGNEHDEKVLNGCQFGCARDCGVVEMLENPVHDNQKMVTYGGSEDKNYYAEIKVCLGCVNCKAEISSISIDPLFTNKGYSTDLVGVGIVQGFTVNFDAVNDYIENVDSEFEYGLVASTFEGELISMENGTPVAKSGVISARIPNGSFKFLEIKLVGITEAQLDTNLVCCAYTVDNGEVFYMSNGATSKTATGKSYNQLKTNE